MDFNAAIFDLDGTILDSMDVWEHIDIQFLKKRNLPVPENYVTEICARSFEEAAQYTIDLLGLQETVEGIIEEWNNIIELAARKLGVAPEHCIVFDDVLPAIKSAKAARMLAGGIYDKYSADQRTEIERIADIYLLDFRQAPIPHKEV